MHLTDTHPMKDPQRFQLIEGIFTPAAARKVLLDLVQRKIDYHQKEKFSEQIRFGADVSQSQHRLDELHKLYCELKALLDIAADKSTDLNVNGWIEVTPTQMMKSDSVTIVLPAANQRPPR
jgi:hypothetical protein